MSEQNINLAPISRMGAAVQAVAVCAIVLILVVAVSFINAYFNYEPLVIIDKVEIESGTIEQLKPLKVRVTWFLSNDGPETVHGVHVLKSLSDDKFKSVTIDIEDWGQSSPVWRTVSLPTLNPGHYELTVRFAVDKGPPAAAVFHFTVVPEDSTDAIPEIRKSFELKRQFRRV